MKGGRGQSLDFLNKIGVLKMDKIQYYILNTIKHLNIENKNSNLK